MTPRNDTHSETESNGAPVDLAAVVALVVATAIAVHLSALEGTLLRPLVGVPFLIVAPGYALVSALFPRANGTQRVDALAPTGGSADVKPATGSGNGRINGVDRLVFSIGMSVVIVAAVGVALNFSPWSVSPTAIVLSVGPLTLALSALAVLRRRSLPPERRFSVPYRAWSRAAQSVELTGSRRDLALNVVLAVCVLTAAIGLVYAQATPDRGESHTELYLLSENESGDLVAGDYPQEFARGEAGTLYLGITNEEREPVEYTVVVELQRVDHGGDGMRVIERQRIDEFGVTLADGETWRAQQTVRPEMTGDELRLTYMLYRGDPPDDPTRENAYRTVDLRIEVS